MVHACAFFNNKGGVGKTTSVANLGDRIGRMSKVAVVDLDPQCNLTQYYMSDDGWESLFLDQSRSVDETVWKFVKPISQSKVLSPDSERDVPLVESDRFSFSLIAGHPFVSRLDDSLAEQWGNYRLAKVGGIESTLWCHQLIDVLDRQIEDLEYVLFDLGPSLGPLNRSVVMACDSFVAPVSPDLFSLYSFDNLSSWFSAVNQSSAAAKLMLEQDSDDYSDSWWMPIFERGLTVQFAGYVGQEYVTRTTKGERRKTKAYARFDEQMPIKARALHDLLCGGGPDKGWDMQIGIMPHMYSMVSLAQDAHAPIGDLRSADRLNGAQFRQRDRYVEDMDVICAEWVRRMNQIGVRG